MNWMVQCLIIAVFSVSIVISNIVGARIVSFGVSVFGIDLATSGGALTYAFTFLCTDIIGEVYGKRQASFAVAVGFACQIFALLLIVATRLLPCGDGSMDAAYDTLLGQNWSFVAGSLCAYCASQSWDVWIFHRVRDWYISRRGGVYDGRGRWLWNNISTLTSQVLDTAIYTSIAFGFGMGMFFDRARFGTLVGICVGQYILKAALAIADTPIFYIATTSIRRRQVQ